MVDHCQCGVFRFSISLFLGEDPDEVWIDISLALLAVNRLAKESKGNRSYTQTSWSIIRSSLCLAVMLQELLPIGDVEKRQGREFLSLRLMAVHASDRKLVKVFFEECPQSLLRAALWDIANMNFHG
jgi:hypothetical protein